MRHIIGSILSFALVLIASGCSTEHKTDFNATLDEATQALADGETELSQSLADELRAVALGPDSCSVDDRQVARLSILFMKLSEQTKEEENTADATRLYLRAFRMSADSLKAFYEALPLDDTPQFVILRRLGKSINSPVPLTDPEVGDSDLLEQLPDSVAISH